MSLVATYQMLCDLSEPPPYLAPTNGICLGDSTVASYLGGNAIAEILFTETEKLNGYTIKSLAVVNDNIAGQKSLWENDPTRHDKDWIIVQVGLNNVFPPPTTASGVLTAYQGLINSINQDKKTSAKVLVATMTPARQRFLHNYGDDDGLLAQQTYLDINNGIMGNGSNSITGVDYRFNGHTLALSDEYGNLELQFQAQPANDGVHENNLARGIIASYWRDALVAKGFL